MLDVDKINNLIGVTESFHASYKLAGILQDKEKREKIFDTFLREEPDLSYDWFTEYFQQEHSDRKGKKQDFTPDGIVRVASGVLGKTESNADICAGTGGLTVKRWSENPNAIFCCEEFSDRAMPFLLFNLAVRNIKGYVLHGDSLSRQFKHIYELSKGEKFSEIKEIKEIPEMKADTVIMNPPYSLQWNSKSEYLQEDRFKEFGILAPKSKADYAFLLQGLYQLSDNGKMAIILPHGILFRGQAEEKIRKKLIEKNVIDAVIGLPEKAFLNTDTPTVLVILKNHRNINNIFFMDASKESKKIRKNNILEDANIEKILNTYRSREIIEKFSRPVAIDEIKENDFNLNIPRYIDTFESEPVASLAKIMEEMNEIDNEIDKTNRTLSNMMSQLVGTTPEADKEIKEFAKFFSQRINTLKIEEGGQINFL